MFVSHLCGARSVQCLCVDVKMIVQVFVSSVVAVMVGVLFSSLVDFSTANGMDIRDQRCFNLGCFGFSFVGEWPCWANAERRSRDEALRMVVNVAGGVD